MPQLNAVQNLGTESIEHSVFRGVPDILPEVHGHVPSQSVGDKPVAPKEVGG